MVKTDKKSALERGLAALSHIDRFILFERTSGKSFRDIAALLNKSVSTVHRRYEQAINKLTED